MPNVYISYYSINLQITMRLIKTGVLLLALLQSTAGIDLVNVNIDLSKTICEVDEKFMSVSSNLIKLYSTDKLQRINLIVCVGFSYRCGKMEKFRLSLGKSVEHGKSAIARLSSLGRNCGRFACLRWTRIEGSKDRRNVLLHGDGQKRPI